MGKTIRLSKDWATRLGFEVKPNEKGRSNASYYLNDELLEAYEAERGKPNERSFVETIKRRDKDGEIVSTIEKLQSDPIEVPENFEIIKISTSKTTGQQWVQYAPKPEEKEVYEIDIESLVAKHIGRIEIAPVVIETDYLFDRVVYTDVHIGMTPNENGFSLYGGKWDEVEIEQTRVAMVNHILSNKKSNILIIDELGDFMDGWDGETVRKGHKLPQNMDNEKAFDVGLSFKVRLIDDLVGHYEKIICHNICNDNHAGSFGYVVNSAVKNIIEAKYANVEITNYRSFIEHYTIENYIFILTHGKDGKNLKFGFKPILDAVQETKINNYIDEHYLFRPDINIEFSKGDSHQDLFDNSTSDKFNYYSYPALSPSSDWIQVNYKKGVRGFYVFNYKADEKKINPKYFKWKRV